MIRADIESEIARRILRDSSANCHIHLGHADAAVVDRLEEVLRINSPVIFGDDLNFSIDQGYIDALNARLASEVLLHPVSSKVSSHAFDAHFDVLDLSLRSWHECAAE